MPPSLILYSVEADHSRMKIFDAASKGRKLHFVCRDEQGGLDEFDMVVVGEIKQEIASSGLELNLRDTSGLIWSMAYDPSTGTGNMMRNFARRS